MTQEEKDLLLDDLCARLSHGVKIQVNDKIETLDSIDILDKVVGYDSFLASYLEEVKPYLFPLSSMTDEQKKELKQYTCPNGTGYFDGYSLCCPVNHFGENIPFEFMSRIIDWLNKNHFDYRGLIEKGLAIDCTNLNIY